MARLQLALRVADLDAATTFFTTLLGTGPHKQRDGYANFAVDDPALKLVLFEDADAHGQIDHLGVEVDSADEVATAIARFEAAGTAVDVRTKELCCHAVQDKVWVEGGDGNRWEVYTIVDDEPVSPEGIAIATDAISVPLGAEHDAACCGDDCCSDAVTKQVPVSASACC